MVLELYRTVASMPDCGLARPNAEISVAYVTAFLDRAHRTGVSLGAFAGQTLVGEIHAARMGPRQFDHVLSDLTIAVHP